LLKGGHRIAEFDYPDEQWFYYQMAERFGWTPDQVDNLPANTADWIMAIAVTVEEVKAERIDPK
jgi:hypothetical protein